MLPIYLILATNEERELFSLLWNKYSLKLLKRINIKVSNMSIAQELVSDTYVALMNNFNRYNDLSEEQLKAMLLTISDHLTINYLKKHSKINILSLHNENIDKNIEETEICDTSIYAHWANKYRIYNVGASSSSSKLYLSIENQISGELTDNDNVILRNNTGDITQQWLISGTNGVKCIKPIMDIIYALHADRSNYPYNSDVYLMSENETNATVIFEQCGSNQYKIKLQAYGLYLTATGNSNGSNVIWSAPSSSNYQIWFFEDVN